MRILVTGGAGFIGVHLCERLIHDGHEVICLDNLDTGRLSNLAKVSQHKNFSFVEADVRDGFGDLQVDRIYSMACPASPRHYRRDPIGTVLTSVMGTLECLRLAQRCGARVFLPSTSEVYGDPMVHPQPETYVGAVNCTGPRACYDEGKRVAETLCFDFHREHGVEVRVARLFNTYGPMMALDDGRVVPNFVTQALSGEPLTVYGAGTQTRSFCYIDDLIEGVVRLMEAPGGLIGPVNLGNPNEFTMRELAEIISEKVGLPATSVEFKDLPEDDPRVRRPDIRKAQEILGWTPTIPLSEGVDRTIGWFRQILQDQRRLEPSMAGPDKEVVGIIGAGPAGLTAAYELLKHSPRHHPVVFEESNDVGGIARTVEYKGNRFDIGGHRFFTKVKSVNALWLEVLPEDFLKRPRVSRIYYHNKFYSYPLKLFNALSNLGIYESLRILLSYFKWKARPYTVEDNFEQWVTNRFGGRLFWHFFKSYTEKVWGMPCTDIRADWAAQRIKNLSLRKAVWHALTGSNDTTSLIEEFNYPRLGPGMMWEAFRDKVREKGGEVRMQSAVTRIYRDEQKILGLEVTTTGSDSLSYRFDADKFISSMPISTLVEVMSPPAPPMIRAAAKRLKYRDFLIVTLILKGTDLFPDNWIYVHSPEVRVGRIQNFRSWSEHLIADPTTTSIGMEYFCQEGDELWTKSDEALKKLAYAELEKIGLGNHAQVVDGTVIRQPKAYPVYDDEYREALDLIRGWLANFPNLQVVGRNGMHRYNNQDHSMLTAMLAVQNILGAEHDLWSVNVEKEYHEDIESAVDVAKSHRQQKDVEAKVLETIKA
jgi:protoporphyrinogen oxidase/nucleoside-diphosphate-sugar epimerase